MLPAGAKCSWTKEANLTKGANTHVVSEGNDMAAEILDWTALIAIATRLHARQKFVIAGYTTAWRWWSGRLRRVRRLRY